MSVTPILGKAQLAVTPEQALNVMRGLELGLASSQKRCALLAQYW